MPAAKLANSIVPSLDDPDNIPAVEAWWRQYAKSKIGESVYLVSDVDGSEAALCAILRETHFGTLAGDMTGHCIIHLDVHLTGESQTAPHIRTAPFRKQQVLRLFNAVMSARRGVGQVAKLNQGDLYIYLDGGKKGNVEQVNKAFVTAKGRFSVVCAQEGITKNQCHVVLSEVSLAERRSKVRGLGCLKQLQGIHIFMNTQTIIPERPRAVYPGTNNGDVIGPVVFEPWKDGWKLTADDKKTLYGDNRRAVGGRSDELAADEVDEDEPVVDPDQDAVDDTDRPTFTIPVVSPGRGQGTTAKAKTVAVEPVFWHLMPLKFYKEVITSYYGRHVIDLTPGAGLFALMCVLMGIGYLGVCFGGPDHKLKVLERLVDLYLQEMLLEGSPVYNANYAKFKAGKLSGEEADGEATGAKPKRKRKVAQAAVGKDGEPEDNKDPIEVPEDNDRDEADATATPPPKPKVDAGGAAGGRRSLAEILAAVKAT